MINYALILLLNKKQ